MADYNSTYTGVQIDANLALAATATQPGDLATVATTGAYTDLSGKPTLGTAAATAATDYATAAQGALADTAVQPADDAADLGSGAATDGYVLTADGAGGAAWEAGGGGSSVTDYLRTRLGTVQDVFNMADTWNASGTTFTGIKLNVTDTASAAASLLMDLQVGGVSRFSVTKAGAASALNLSLSGASGATIAGGGANAILFATESVYRAAYRATYFNLAANMALGFSSDTAFSVGSVTDPDTVLRRDAANTLAQRNGVNAQAFNLYNTYTDASNYERGFMRFVSNTLRIGTEKLGTGAARNLEFQVDGTTKMSINTGGAVVANTAFYGATGSTYFGWANSALMTSPSVGVIRLNNFAETDFNRVQFGGTTSSFPSIKRSTTSLQARLADDSAFTNIQGKLTTEANAVSETITATHTITLYDAAGTAYKVPCVAV